MDSTGTVIFATVGRHMYGFDVFSISTANDAVLSESRLIDGASVNFNAQFLDDNKSVVFVSERTGCPRIYLTSPSHAKPVPLPSAPSSLFHDRLVVCNNTLYFISAHEDPGRPFRSWSALYSC